MRVLHVSEVSWGGVVSILNEVMKEQASRGHEVNLLAPEAFSLTGVGNSLHHRWTMDRRRPATYPGALAQLNSVIRRVQPDIVHLHSAIAGIVGRLPALAVTGVPVVYQPHAWSFDLHEGKRFGELLRRWERYASTRTKVLVANCTDEIEEGRRSGITIPARALGVPLDGNHFHPVHEGAARLHRAEVGIDTQHVILCLGRLVRQKGQDQLVAAWEAAPVPNTTLLLVGPGDPAPLKAMAPHTWGRTIRWCGEHSDVRPWLWASDLLVLPSRYETVAVVVGEAMACGRPVVATRVNGVDMAVSDGPYSSAGAVVSPGNMVDLLKECQRRLEDKQQWRRESTAGRERALMLFNTTAVVDRLDAAYQQAIQPRVPAERVQRRGVYGNA